LTKEQRQNKADVLDYLAEMNESMQANIQSAYEKRLGYKLESRDRMPAFLADCVFVPESQEGSGYPTEKKMAENPKLNRDLRKGRVSVQLNASNLYGITGMPSHHSFIEQELKKRKIDFKKESGGLGDTYRFDALPYAKAAALQKDSSRQEKSVVIEKTPTLDTSFPEKKAFFQSRSGSTKFAKR